MKTPDSILTTSLTKKHENMEALFLNRVQGIEWYYFQLDLNKHAGKSLETSYMYKRETPKQLLIEDRIKKDERGNFHYDPTLGQGTRTVEMNKTEVLVELLAYIRQYPDAPRKLLKRIFDANEPSVINGSGAHLGALGKANRRNHNKRERKFRKRIRSKGFDRNDKCIIMAEGDSWFNFPPARILGNAVKDIIDYLCIRPEYAVYSLASGGDWLSNMVKTADYIDMLDRINPDVFLFSGGGNDMVGDYRLAKMISRDDNPRSEALEQIIQSLKKVRLKPLPPKDMDLELYERGLPFLTIEFFNFINVTMSQYFLLLSEIYSLEKFQNLKFITHGYDFPIPSSKKRGFPISRQRALNLFLDTGKWMHDVMQIKRIYDPKDQQAIMYAMIYEFNEMLIQLANYKHFKNLYHIDCRGTALSIRDWFDELHLKSGKFRMVANTFNECIKGDSTQKVYKVRKDLSFTNQV